MRSLLNIINSSSVVWGYFTRPQKKTLIFTLLVFSLLILFWWSSSVWYEDRLLAEQRAEVTFDLNQYSTSLVTSVDSRFALLEGLHAFTSLNPSNESLERDFNVYASGLYSSADGIRNFAVAPGGVQQYVYPVEGNEVVFGHDLINDERPEVREDVQRTIDTSQSVLSGPYELRQGGLGLVERRAVFIDGSFWGLVTMVIDMEPIFEETGLSSASDLDLALRDTNGNIFYGDANVFEKDPVVLRISLPDGHWELAGIPENGWDDAIGENLFIFRSTGLIIVLLLTLLFYLDMNHQRSLSLAVEERTEELSKAYEKLNSLDKMKDEFISNVGHELKTPLVSIEGYSNLVYDENMGSLNEQQKKAMEVIVRNSKRLEGLINSLLYLSVETGASKRDDFDKLQISDVLEEAISSIQKRAADSSVTIEDSIPSDLPLIDGNMKRLSDLFANILDNAIKFTPSGGSISVLASERDNDLYVCVEDNGIGISEEQMPYIFDKFYQVDSSTTRRYGGTGLGLYIAKKIVAEHNGDLVVESEEGVGTKVCAILPK